MSDRLADLLETAGLTGRGGAGFSTATKLRVAREHGARLVVNACDGEPAARKDGWVVEHHLAELVHGAALVAGGARFAAHRGSRTEALLRAAGLDVLAVPHRYVSSEETALASLAAGGLARPTTKRRPLAHTGTLVLNAETLWRVAQIAERGPAWFRSFGTPAEPGPRLVTTDGRVVETQAGVPLSELAEPCTLLVGGLAGAYLSDDEVRRTAWSDAELAAYGARTGAGLLEPVRGDLREDVLTRLRYAAGESAGQCGPCLFGLPALVDDWQGRDAGRLLDRIALLPGRGACRFPDGVAGLVRSALRLERAHV